MSVCLCVDQCTVVANNDRLQSYSCVYVPSVEGQYKVTIKFAKQDVPKCPYLVAVGKPGDAKKVTAQGPGIEKTGVQVNRKTYFEVITKGKPATPAHCSAFDSSILYGRRAADIHTYPVTPHSFIPGLRPCFSANPSHRSLPFLLLD